LFTQYYVTDATLTVVSLSVGRVGET